MAKVDGDLSLFMTPAAYSNLKNEKKTESTKRSEKTRFLNIFESAKNKTEAGGLGPLPNMPVSDDTVNILMDEVRSAGDSLRDRPFPEEILHYKKAVRNFMHYIVENTYTLKQEDGIQNYLKEGYSGSRGKFDVTTYTKIQVIDKKMEDLAAMLLSSQRQQIELASRLEEIRGLLIDLLE